MTYVLDPAQMDRINREAVARCPDRFKGNRKQRIAWCQGYSHGWFKHDMDDAGLVESPEFAPKLVDA